MIIEHNFNSNSYIFQKLALLVDMKLNETIKTECVAARCQTRGKFLTKLK